MHCDCVAAVKTSKNPSNLASSFCGEEANVLATVFCALSDAKIKFFAKCRFGAETGAGSCAGREAEHGPTLSERHGPITSDSSFVKIYLAKIPAQFCTLIQDILVRNDGVGDVWVKGVRKSRCRIAIVRAQVSETSKNHSSRTKSSQDKEVNVSYIIFDVLSDDNIKSKKHGGV